MPISVMIKKSLHYRNAVFMILRVDCTCTNLTVSEMKQLLLTFQFSLECAFSS